jgi:hypothetical protein
MLSLNYSKARYNKHSVITFRFLGQIGLIGTVKSVHNDQPRVPNTRPLLIGGRCSEFRVGSCYKNLYGDSTTVVAVGRGSLFGSRR